MIAVALNSSLFNASRIVGPALAGLVMGAWGIGWCFAINSLSFVPLLFVLPRLPKVFVPSRPVGAPICGNRSRTASISSDGNAIYARCWFPLG